MNLGRRYRVRSGAVVAFDHAEAFTTLPIGTEFVFRGPGASVPHRDARKHRAYFITLDDGTGLTVVLPVMKIFPGDDEKDPNKWYDNAPLLMFESVAP